MVFDGRETHPTIEGPKLYKRNGYYYIFAPAGGVATGWQTVLRARSIYGPYESQPSALKRQPFVLRICVPLPVDSVA